MASDGSAPRRKRGRPVGEGLAFERHAYAAVGRWQAPLAVTPGDRVRAVRIGAGHELTLRRAAPHVVLEELLDSVANGFGLEYWGRRGLTICEQ